ncbi:RCC1 and BTB domain-containing protein 1-like isoform X2 [Lycorma delicatula]|uniref:RCC1 and BTB domain-containing protein 1-like isoform X2 n=1 Tax=Lycorma delicatula TaxID=130591 RepID=UPI003F50EB33
MNLDKWSIFSLLNPEFKSKIRSAFVFGGGSEAFVITESDDVYGLGQNSCSCLGIDSTESTLEPKKVEELCGKKVKAFASGCGANVVALTEKGEIYVWGHNKFGELGNEGCNTKVPGLLPGLADVVIEEIACGGHHTLALDKDGKVYGWGQNNNGQIEYTLRANSSRFRQIITTIGVKKIKNIACTNSASFAVSHNGKVYAWGNRENGQLGLPHDTNISQPFKIPGFDNAIIVKVACGFSHVLALSDSGNIIAWGSNNYGQIGIGSKSNVYLSPVRTATEIERVVDIAATPDCHISAALTLTGSVYMWGQYRGHSVTTPMLTPFKLMSDIFASFAKPAVMNSLLPIWTEDSLSVIASLKHAFNDPNTSDLTIMVDGKLIYVHKGILKIRSEYFHSMFKGEWKECCKSPLEIDKFSFPVYKAYLYYLYTGIIDIEPEAVLGLLELSNFYCEEGLKRKCEQIIKSRITPENAALLYVASVTYNTRELEDFCLKYSLNHMTAIVQSEAFLTFDLETMRDFIQKAAQAGAFRS